MKNIYLYPLMIKMNTKSLLAILCMVIAPGCKKNISPAEKDLIALNNSISKQSKNIAEFDFDTAFFSGDTVVISFTDSLDHINPLVQDQKVSYALFELNQLHLDLKSMMKLNIHMPNRKDGDFFSAVTNTKSYLEFLSIYQDKDFKVIIDHIFSIHKEDPQHFFINSLNLEIASFMIEKNIPGDYFWGVSVYNLISGYIHECRQNKKGLNSEAVDNLIGKNYGTRSFTNTRKVQLFSAIKKGC